ncbi:hypothetical protein N7478_010647 [Penicillium angulare]|uniref:uncharacterized protein n=1 Tax=Penicillium angulare TaxID=116970 RepID=UPI0025403AAD|nr:uncharacterized protein N7478_010647 [Penicillium angulare]KAJ5267839.1 hypothetical protein N7478_010647 [Penicillium angulare]
MSYASSEVLGMKRSAVHARELSASWAMRDHNEAECIEESFFFREVGKRCMYIWDRRFDTTC